MANYQIYHYQRLFGARYKFLIQEVVNLRKKYPDTYKSHPKTKLLAKIRQVSIKLSEDPTAREYHLGKTLPPELRCYKRIKSGLPVRMRLFFRFNSEEKKVILVWMNDENTLRKAGSKNDVYYVFTKIAFSRQIPKEWKSLLSSAAKWSLSE